MIKEKFISYLGILYNFLKIKEVLGYNPRGKPIRHFLPSLVGGCYRNLTLSGHEFSDKYCKDRCDIDMFAPTPNMSNVWCGITENARWVNKGSAMAIGNGRRLLFWDHCWVTDDFLSQGCVTSYTCCY